MQQSPTSAETIVYRFSPGAPAFKYVSGDLPCEVEAILRGNVSLIKNDNSDEAVLEFGDVTIHSAQTLLFGAPYDYPEGHYCREFAESLEAATLSIVMPGVDAPLIGTRAAPTQFMFGPSLTDEQDFMRQFTLDESERKLNGSLIFYGDDGPSYFINASLSVVPEPTFGAMLAVLAAIVISMGRCRL